jgi:CubicO group peptidase (beta-lactamase class C family)
MKYIFILLFLISTAQSFSQSKDYSKEQLKDSITHYSDLANIPGMSFAQLKDFEVSNALSIGLKSYTTKNTVNNNTVFEAASLTKPVVAYCALKLIEEGLLELDKPLSEYYQYSDIIHDDDTKTITARMVLSHTSGFPNWRSNRVSDTLNLRFLPNTKFNYSGEGFVYLQRVMETVKQNDLDEIVKEFVFDPLYMNNSMMIFHTIDNFAVGHDLENKEIEKFKPKTANAAYSLHTTGSDYAKFLVELVNPIYIDKNLIKEMLSKQKKTMTEGGSISWGLGIGLNFTKDGEYIWHWGDNKYFKAFFIASKKTGDGFTYFTNGENGLTIVQRMIRLTLNDSEILKEWDKYEQL